MINFIKAGAILLCAWSIVFGIVMLLPLVMGMSTNPWFVLQAGLLPVFSGAVAIWGLCK